LALSLLLGALHLGLKVSRGHHPAIGQGNGSWNCRLAGLFLLHRHPGLWSLLGNLSNDFHQVRDRRRLDAEIPVVGRQQHVPDSRSSGVGVGRRDVREHRGAVLAFSGPGRRCTPAWQWFGQLVRELVPVGVVDALIKLFILGPLVFDARRCPVLNRLFAPSHHGQGQRLQDGNATLVVLCCLFVGCRLIFWREHPGLFVRHGVVGQHQNAMPSSMTWKPSSAS
jgi:hypothetical protein